MTALTEAINTIQNHTLTENGATAFRSSNDDLTDLFACIGAMRSDRSRLFSMFSRAYTEDPKLAVKMIFYARDIREGLGERETARQLLQFLAVHEPSLILGNLANIAEFGRYDDLVDLIDAPAVKDGICSFLKEQLTSDMACMKENKPVSLCAKWMPSITTSSKNTVRLARILADTFGMGEREYRKMLSSLRSYINITEVNLSARAYEKIDYAKVPSRAMMNYRNAFFTHDEERFSEFIASVKKGRSIIHSSVLYPYDIIEKILYHNEFDDTLQAQWDALPDYTEGNERFLIMADVSGSMYGRPMATSVGLGIYFAQHNHGPFANQFMTFSGRPELVTLKGNNLKQIAFNMVNAEWECNTNIEAAFNLVLNAAVEAHAAKQDMPSSIVIITDMEFDACTDGSCWGFYDEMALRFKQAGYEIPNIVFWNVSSRHDTFHASAHTKGVQLASGQSASVFKNLVNGQYMTAYEYMCSVLNVPRYDCVFTG
ncbi:MAG: DUF2828 family protein [Solobacterium sp.]|jgi:hypothetical protein|nr:DUF2828 family protein [Solobacterium sp.]MCH4221930.1 DUF2828 family protein [Solobacterium sp.]MCH4265244.1 DUF2828 family protein [Solobacterium sp.]